MATYHSACSTSGVKFAEEARSNIIIIVILLTASHHILHTTAISLGGNIVTI